jgi:HAD superfamily hydrolase (TIGR01509 family)
MFEPSPFEGFAPARGCPIHEGKMLEALIFDVDGTLADTERDGHRVAFNRAFAEAGLDWDWSADLYGKLLSITGGKERIKYYIDRHAPEFSNRKALGDFVAGLHASKTKFYSELLETGTIPLRPGVRRLLIEAKETGLRLAIATTTTPQNVTVLLENSMPGSLSLFEFIGAGDVVPKKKPAPDIYHFVLGQLKLRPDQCLAFEDSALGLKAALGAGLKTIITVNGYTASQDFTGATLAVDKLGEPHEPFKVLSGNNGHSSYFDVGLANRLMLHAD